MRSNRNVGTGSQLGKAYVSVPVLGNINIGTRGNIGLGNFLYPTANGGLTTFMNSSVSAQEFLNGLNANNRLAMNVDMSILSAGFRAWGGFNTIDIGLRSHTSVNIPKDMLELMKVGQSGPTTVYDMGDMGMSSANYVEVALGHSRQITDKLRVGAKVKFLSERKGMDCIGKRGDEPGRKRYDCS